MTDPAPLRDDLADGPEPGGAVWVRTADGVRLRVGGWRAGAKGTVLLFNGRSEYIEKYGRLARDLARRDLALASLDWRGQGYSDRLLHDAHVGHVGAFADYQADVAAFVDAVGALGYPKPWFLLGHSMGGAIGLRALTLGLAVERAVFSAPMWGIHFSPWLQPLVGLVTSVAAALGRGAAYAPGTGPVPYPIRQPFEGNTLTHDREMYDWMRGHIRAEPRLGLGGPSYHWLREACAEARALADVPDVPCPALALVGSEEAIVEKGAVHRFAARWANGASRTIPGARHEAMMETPELRAAFNDAALEHFLAA